jgi:hypothetical protein
MKTIRTRKPGKPAQAQLSDQRKQVNEIRQALDDWLEEKKMEAERVSDSSAAA